MHQTYSWFPRHSTPCFCIKRNIYTINPLWRHYKLLREFYMCFSSIPQATEHPGTPWRRNPWAQLSTPPVKQEACTARCCWHSFSLSALIRHKPGRSGSLTNLLVDPDDRESSGEADLWISFKQWDSLLWPSGVSDWSSWAFLRTTAAWCSSSGSTKRKKTEIRRNDNAKYYCL